MNKKSILTGGLFSVLMAGLIFFVGFTQKDDEVLPSQLYQVYLDGEVIGVINSKDELLNLIDKEQETLKNKYDVDKIYPPKGLEIEKIYTYNGEINTANYIYEKIKDIRPFTIKGSIITIKSENKDEEDKIINVLNKKDFDKALENTIKAFVNENEYNKYLNGTQEEVTDTGSKINNVDIKEDITIKEGYISAEEQVFTDSQLLSKYLLFGTLEEQEYYTVTANDTIDSVAEAHNLSKEELLIANPEIKNAKTFLYSGQKLNIGLISPLVKVSVVKELSEKQEVKYTTTTKYDPNIAAGTTYVEQQGSNGVNKLTYQQEEVNGEILTLVIINTEEVTPMVERVVKKGGSNINIITNGDWTWPTTYPYVITSQMGWRWYRYHRGIDISGTGAGSPIYAATTGVVEASNSNCANVGYYGNNCGNQWGNYVKVRNSDGYLIIYAHLQKNVEVQTGQNVSTGQIIGYMGSSGSSTGTHLHFEINTSDGTPINPLRFY